MSQDVSTNQRVREPLTASAPIQPWSPESEADKLMDELFSDIDRILDGGSKLPTEPAKPEYISLQSMVIPQITVPPVVMPPQELLQQPSAEPTEATLSEPLEKTLIHTASPQTNRWNWSFEKFVLVAGLTSLVVTIILLLANKVRPTWPWSMNFATAPVAPTTPLSESEAQFVSYMLRSLEVIDNKAKTKKQTTASGSASTANLPSISIPGNRSLATNQAPTVLERVYIPYYPPQTSFPRPATLPPVRPSFPVTLPTVRPSIPATSSTARPSIPATPPPARPRPSASVSPQAVAPTTGIPTLQAASPATASSNYTLVGLQTGERPVCLFNIDGVTQRIHVGETIGSSGWTLVAVTNEEALIRRNGEVRSIYPGQKF